MWDLRWQPGVGEPLSHFPDLPSQTISNNLTISTTPPNPTWKTILTRRRHFAQNLNNKVSYSQRRGVVPKSYNNRYRKCVLFNEVPAMVCLKSRLASFFSGRSEECKLDFYRNVSGWGAGSCWEISDVNQGRPLGWIYRRVPPNLVRTGGAKIWKQGDN